MTKEYFSLRSENVNLNLSVAFKDILNEKIFSDVTLVSDDGMQIKAHRIVVSSFSPLLRNLLLTNSSSHPIIYLRGITQQELQSILQFMYLGEVAVHQSHLENILDCAKDLKVKELLNVCEQNEELVRISKESSKSECNVQNVPGAGYENDNNSEDLKSETEYTVDVPLSLFPDQTGLQDRYINDKGLIYSCTQCKYQSKDKGNLNKHKQAQHDGVRYICDHCDYRANYQGDLKMHKKAKHEDVRHPCKQCEYQATCKGNLDKHKLSQHEGVKFACNQCDYKVTQLSTLVNT